MSEFEESRDVYFSLWKIISINLFALSTIILVFPGIGIHAVYARYLFYSPFGEVIRWVSVIILFVSGILIVPISVRAIFGVPGLTIYHNRIIMRAWFPKTTYIKEINRVELGPRFGGTRLYLKNGKFIIIPTHVMTMNFSLKDTIEELGDLKK